MSTNNKISNLISSQMPFFVRNDHPNFVRFVEAYYEWMEQNGKVVEVAKNLPDYKDIDTSVDEFTEHLYNTFLKMIPADIAADKAMILKHAKEFYRAKGSEKSISFLLRILFGAEVSEPDYYYPKEDVLRASDGKWFIEKSLKFSAAYINNVDVTNDLEKIRFALANRTLRGNTSAATAVVERVDSYTDGNELVREVKISQQTKDFVGGENVYTTFVDTDGTTKLINLDIFSGIVSSVRILNGGSGYSVGDRIVVESNTGSGAIIEVASISGGGIRSVYVSGIEGGGAGFQNAFPVIVGGGGGSGANVRIQYVRSDGKFHPNTYNIIIDLIGTEANTNLLNTLAVSSGFETLSYANLATQFVKLAPNTTNLTITTGQANTLILTDNAANSNIGFVANSVVNVGGRNLFIDSISNNTFKIYPGLSSNVGGRNIFVPVSRATSNVRANSGLGAVVTQINLVQAAIARNTSNLLANTGVASDTIILNDWAANTNITISVGTVLQVNGVNTTVQTLTPNSNTITVFPAVGSNLVSNVVFVYGTVYRDMWAGNSNVSISNNSTLRVNTVNGFVNVFVTNTATNSSTIDIYPSIEGNVFNSVFSVYDTAVANSTPSNVKVSASYSNTVTLSGVLGTSNVYFRTGDYVTVNGVTGLINTSSDASASLEILPGLEPGLTANTVIVMRTPFNATSNLTLSTGAGVSVTTATLSGLLSTSNVFFETNDSLVVGSNTVIITASNTQTNTINVAPGLPGSLSGVSFNVVKKANANTRLIDAFNTFVYGNTGPIERVEVITGGTAYITIPTLTADANTSVRNLGILGRMRINNGGSGYVVGDTIEFISVGGYGAGAGANVTNVDANGAITEVKFTEVPGHIIGGSGYSDITGSPIFPVANVVSSTGNGANVQVIALLGRGDKLGLFSDELGVIQSLTIVSGGSGYEEPPTLNLTSIGDGTAQANAEIVTGAFVYPGRWLNDDGQISSYNFLQDRDYYQNFSYVIKVNQSIELYRSLLKNFAHPAGMKLFGEFTVVDDDGTKRTFARFQGANTSNTMLYYAPYETSGNGISNTSNVTISALRDISSITNVYVEFRSSNVTINLSNGVYNVVARNTSSNTMYISIANTVNANGSLIYRSYP